MSARPSDHDQVAMFVSTQAATGTRTSIRCNTPHWQLIFPGGRGSNGFLWHLHEHYSFSSTAGFSNVRLSLSCASAASATLFPEPNELWKR